MSNKAPNGLLARNLGGTISSSDFVAGTDKLYDPKKPVKGQRIEVKPERGKIQRLIEVHVDKHTKDKLPSPILFAEGETIKDSAEYNVVDLMRIVKEVRSDLRRCKNRSMLLTAGTDNAASLAHAIAEGVAEDLLGDRTIIIAVSNDHVSNGEVPTNRHAAIVSLVNSIYLSTCAEIKGRIGVCTGLNFHAPRGLLKVSTRREPFNSRFVPIACAIDQPQPEWAFTMPVRPCDKADGREHAYVLASGIETWKLSPTSEYANVPIQLAAAIDPSCVYGGKMIARIRGKSKERKINGLVLQAPGTANLQQNPDELAHIVEATELGEKAGVPVILIADPLQPEDFYTSKGEDVGYGGSFGNIQSILERLSSKKQATLINGGDLTQTEATLLLSAAVARAKQHHKHQGPDVVGYTSEYVDNYLQKISTQN